MQPDQLLSPMQLEVKENSRMNSAGCHNLARAHLEMSGPQTILLTLLYMGRTEEGLRKGEHKTLLFTSAPLLSKAVVAW